MGKTLAEKLLKMLADRFSFLAEHEGLSWRNISHLMELEAEKHHDPEYFLSHVQVHRLAKGKRNLKPPPERVIIKRLRAVGVDVPEILRELSEEEAVPILQYVEGNQQSFKIWARALRRGKYVAWLNDMFAALERQMEQDEGN